MEKNKTVIDTIVIYYWKSRIYKEFTYKHGEKFSYSQELRNSIVEDVLSKGFQLMIMEGYLSYSNELHITIDKEQCFRN